MIYNSALEAFSYITRLCFSNGLVTLNLAVVVVATLVLYIYLRFYKYSDSFMQMANKIPGPRCYPIIGSAYFFGTNPKDILQSVSDCLQFGDVSGYWIGPLFYVGVLKAHDLELILGSSNLIKKSYANDLMRIAIGDGILTSSGEKWKKHRKFLQPTFHQQILEDYVGVFISKSKILNDLLDTQVEEADIDIAPFTNNFAYDILKETLMATKSNEQLTGHQAQFATSLSLVTSILTCRFFRPWMYLDCIFFRTPSGKEFRHHLHLMHDSTRQIISRKQEKMKDENNLKMNGYTVENDKKKRKSFLDYLLERAFENNLNKHDIFEESNTIMMTGFETTASALAFLCFFLSKRFDIQEKIIEEIQEVLGSLEEKTFTYQQVQNLKYLDRVVKETLRIFPTVPYIARQITEDTKLPSGYTLPNGCGVIIPFFSLHRDPEQYPNPHVFDPDNFLPEIAAVRHPFSYCPFSAGPRNCIGQRYAMVQLKTFAVCLLRRFWLTPTDCKLELASKLTMISRTGVRIGLKKRTQERPVIPDIEKLSKSVVTNIEFFNFDFKDSYL